MSMKAHRLRFDNLIDIDPRTGTIKLNNKRMALVSVEALGILRRDLINTLSMERAKGFLMRYGWACGYKDGESMEQMYEWDSKNELMLSGPALHTLEGIVTVEPDQIDLSDDYLHFTGHWRNSFEADEHISHFGHSSEPVCWMLVGYASGFLTKTFGKEVIVHEKHCRGKRDPQCYFVARTVELCDPKQQADLRYYKADSLSTELDRVYQEVNELNENIIETEHIHSRLTELLLEDKELSEIIRLISHVLQRSVIIDHHLEVLESAYFKASHEEAYRKWAERSASAADPLWHIETFPIQPNKILLGRMAVIGEGPLNNRERMIIQRSLTVCTISLFHTRKMSQSLWTRKEQFFEEILSQTFDEDTLKRKAHFFDFNPSEPSRLITMKTSVKDQTDEMLAYVAGRFPKLDIFVYQGYIVMIMPIKESKNESFSREVLQLVCARFPDTKTHIGTGRVANSFGSLAKSYQDACRICDFVQLTYPADSRIATFEEMEPIVLFLKGADQEELIQFCRQTIGKLIEYDKENQGNLVVTLKSYLDNNGNLQQTAHELHLSVAGLRYRLERIESLSDIDLRSGIGRFHCQLSIRFFFTLQVINKTSGI